MKSYIVLRGTARPSLRGGGLRSGATPAVTVERIDERHLAQLREEPDARLVAARLSASARREVFGQGVDAIDVGDGFLTAPE